MDRKTSMAVKDVYKELAKQEPEMRLDEKTVASLLASAKEVRLTPKKGRRAKGAVILFKGTPSLTLGEINRRAERLIGKSVARRGEVLWGATTLRGRHKTTVVKLYVY